MALANRFGDLVNIEGALGDQDRICATGNTAVECDPARIATHYFNYHDAVVRLGCGVYAIDRLAHNVARRIEPEGVVGATQVVVDGLGNAYDFDSFFVELLRDRKSVVSANGNQGVNLVRIKGLNAAIKTVGALRGIGAGGAENGSSTR